MTDSNYTHLIVVMDRSGSMSSIRSDMEGALNGVFKEQAELDGKCLVDLVQFDDRYDVVYTDRPVSSAKAVLQPRGLTALLDAIGKTIVTTGEKFAALAEDERPGTVIVVVVTDGLENRSTEYTKEQVADLVKQQTDEWDWKFTFLGANMDAVSEGAAMGFSKGSSITFDPNAVAVAAAGTSLSNYVTVTRGGGSYQYTDEDRDATTGAAK